MVVELPVKCKGPARTPDLFPLLTLLLKYTELSEIHLLCGGKFDLLWMEGCGRLLHRFGGLTRFWRNGEDRFLRTDFMSGLQPSGPPFCPNLGLRPRLRYCAPLALGCGGGSGNRQSAVGCPRPTLSPKGRRQGWGTRLGCGGGSGNRQSAVGCPRPTLSPKRRRQGWGTRRSAFYEQLSAMSYEPEQWVEVGPTSQNRDVGHPRLTWGPKRSGALR